MEGRMHFLVLTLVILLAVGTACSPATTQPSAALATLPPTQPPTEVPTVTPTNTSTPAPTATRTNTPTPAPTATPTNSPTPTPTFTPTPVPMGASRRNPIPLGEVHQTVNWELQVLEVKRGDAAWVDIQAASKYNKPLPEGLEYVLVRLRAKNISTEDAEKGISNRSFALTSDRNLIYEPPWFFLHSPEPALEAKLYPGGEVEGWAVMQASAGESNLILIHGWERYGRKEPAWFFALEGEGIPPRPVEPCEGISTTTRSEPAPFSEKVCAGSWEVQVLEVIRGADAWAALQAASDMNDPPGQGMEYMLVKLYTRNISPADEPISLSGWDFESIGDKNVVYDTPSVYILPGPEIGDVEQYPGGEFEGWVVLQAAEGEGNLVAIFEPEHRVKAFLALQ